MGWLFIQEVQQVTHIYAFTALSVLMVLAGAMVVTWCIATDERYMDTWRDNDE